MKDNVREQIKINNKAINWSMASIPVTMAMIIIPPILSRIIGLWALLALPILFVVPFGMIGYSKYLSNKAARLDINQT